MTQFVQRLSLSGHEKSGCFRQFLFSGGQTKNRIAVKHGVRRPNGPGHAIVCHLCHFLSLGGGENSICCHDSDGGISDGFMLRFRWQPDGAFPLLTKLIIDLQPDFPGSAVDRIDHRTVGVDRYQCSHCDSGVQYQAGGTQSAFDAA